MSTTRRSSSTTRKDQKSKRSAVRSAHSSGLLNQVEYKKLTSQIDAATRELVKKENRTLYSIAQTLGFTPQGMYSKFGIRKAMLLLKTIGYKMEFQIVRAK